MLGEGKSFLKNLMKNGCRRKVNLMSILASGTLSAVSAWTFLLRNYFSLFYVILKMILLEILRFVSLFVCLFFSSFVLSFFLVISSTYFVIVCGAVLYFICFVSLFDFVYCFLLCHVCLGSFVCFCLLASLVCLFVIFPRLSFRLVSHLSVF